MEKRYITSSIPLYGEYILPDNVFDELRSTIEYEENNSTPFSKGFSVDIKESFLVKKIDENVLSYLESCAKDFYLQIKKTTNDFYFYNKKKKNDENYQIECKLESLWFNRQKRNEFNPIHHHGGTISFVCWIKIPYNLDDEIGLNLETINTKSNSLFEFISTNYLGEIFTKKLYIDKSWEGKSIFFDSRLKHHVYPFNTIDEDRISISGNFTIIPVKRQSFEYK